MLDFLFSLPPALMTALATVIGFALLGDLTTDEQNSLSSFLMLCAQVLATNASQQQLVQESARADEFQSIKAEMAELRRQIAELSAP